VIINRFHISRPTNPSIYLSNSLAPGIGTPDRTELARRGRGKNWHMHGDVCFYPAPTLEARDRRALPIKESRNKRRSPIRSGSSAHRGERSGELVVSVSRLLLSEECGNREGGRPLFPAPLLWSVSKWLALGKLSLAREERARGENSAPSSRSARELAAEASRPPRGFGGGAGGVEDSVTR